MHSCRQLICITLSNDLKSESPTNLLKLSEGMCGAIMEAMALGVPVIARLIPGNAAVVTHMVYRLSIHKEGFTSDRKTVCCSKAPKISSIKHHCCYKVGIGC